MNFIKVNLCPPSSSFVCTCDHHGEDEDNDLLQVTSTSALLILNALPSSILGMRRVNLPSKSNRRTLSRKSNEDAELKRRESKPKVLPDNDPVLTEGSGDPVLHGVLVDGPKVDVGSGSPLLLVG